MKICNLRRSVKPLKTGNASRIFTCYTEEVKTHDYGNAGTKLLQQKAT